MRVVAIIQARATGSTRLGLPKVLAKLDGKRTMLECVVDRVRLCKRVDDVVVAIPRWHTPCEMELDTLCRDRGWHTFAGPEDDVLHRYRLAAEAFRADHILRVTADCPFLSPEAIDRVVLAHLSAGADFTANNLPTDAYPDKGDNVGRSYPHGFDCECMTLATLVRADDDKSLTPYQREHVTEAMRDGTHTPYLWPVEADNPQPDLRLTVDTPEDLEMTRALYAYLGERWTTEDLYTLCRALPDVLAINGSVWR